MNLQFNQRLSSNYSSSAQKIRVMSEDWVGNNLYCPNCNSLKLSVFTNNNPVGDFYCVSCSEQFELKSKNGVFGSSIVDGAYHKMIDRISSNQNPNFLFLSYDRNFTVNDLFLIPKQFFIPEIIQKRKPLSVTARRAGWVGCNILLSKLPQLGQISIIRDLKVINPKEVRRQWSKTLKIRTEHISKKGWMFEILSVVERTKKKTFTLEDIYSFEFELKFKFPENQNIKPKIRQQLQKLRDFGYLEFLGNGKYTSKI